MHLNTPVRRVDWSGRGVVVQSAAGDLQVQAAIVTASTGVLASGAIEFTPALPDWKQLAFDDLPMGLLAKVALQFGPDHFGLDADTWLVRDALAGRPCSFCAGRWQQHDPGLLRRRSGLGTGRPGTARGAGLRADPSLASAGKQDQKQLSPRAFHPLGTKRAYAGAPPGSAGARNKAARPLGKRVFFASEAMGGAFAQTCDGAWMSGEAVARQVAHGLP